MRRFTPRSLPPVRGGRFLLAFAVAALLVPAAFAWQDAADAPPAAAPAGEEAAAAEAGPKTGPKLPRNIQPPPPKPASFTNVKPLLSPEALDKLGADVRRARYQDVLEVGPTDKDRKVVVENWARWRVAQLTGLAPPPETDDEDAEPPPPRPLVEDRRALSDAVDELIREATRNVGPRGGGRNLEAVRMAVYPILAAELVKLKDNHLVLRTQAIKALSRLEVAGGGRGNPVKRYGPAVGPLLEIYDATGDSGPELAVKYQAATMLAFVAENGRDVPGALKIQAGERFAQDLADHPEYPGWMQGGLAAAVARLGLGGSTVARQLMTAVTDESRPFEARTRTAAALVRLPGVPSDVKDALPAALQNLGAAMARGYNASFSPRTGPATEYVENFRTLEFAFKPLARSEKDRLGGTLLSEADGATPAFPAIYNRIHPLVKHVANQDLSAATSAWTPIPAALLAPLGPDAG